jgi:hypothetical protein
MKYYSFRNVVIKCTDDTNWKDVVYKMRSVVNWNTFHPVTIMIEDIKQVEKEDYLEYQKLQTK